MPQLEDRWLDIFGGHGLDLERYLHYIPFSWTSSNGLAGITMGPQSLLDMMTFSMFLFHIDELFDLDLVRGNDAESVKQLPERIKSIFSRVDLQGDIPDAVKNSRSMIGLSMENSSRL